MSEFSRFQNALTDTGRFQSDDTAVPETITVLHVDDEPDLADLTATYLERQHDDFEITTQTTIDSALETLETESVDCIVSDYDMPSMNGLEFLETVRARDGDLPFILFTGKGSEEIASEAISSGVTDYLQKEVGTGQYPVLANRIRNAVEQHRAKRAVERAQKRFSKLIENSTDVISVVGDDARFQYLSPSAKHIFGYEPEEMVGEYIFDYAHPDDRQGAMESFFEAVKESDQQPVVKFRFKHEDGSWPVLESRGRNLLDDPDIRGFVVNSRDVTELEDHERTLKRQSDQLEGITNAISHDLRNPLNVAQGSVELARESSEPEHLDRIERSLSRIDEIVESTLVLAEQGRRVSETGDVSLEAVATAAWEMVDTAGANLRVEGSATLVADESRTKQLLENLVSNAVEHGSPSPRTSCEDAVEHGSESHSDDAASDEGVAVRVGVTDDGFYVADDGRGIPADEREQVFESGYSTTETGTGFGLAIVKQIAHAHGWCLSVGDSADGGARFEITGVEFSDR
ncbi:response regulator [Halorussus amylolyticus]|uniref:response regulator n=1 Tax=Halorussus amylolyticus TaxID=1126242 RepID=UPI001050A07D|nr:response regulator [Halorussus amylolyticus]